MESRWPGTAGPAQNFKSFTKEDSKFEITMKHFLMPKMGSDRSKVETWKVTVRKRCGK